MQISEHLIYFAMLSADASVIVHYYGIHFSEAIWADPFVFKPERFLDAQGRYQANPNNLPFATG